MAKSFAVAEPGMTAAVPAPAASMQHSYVDWGAIIAGALIAAAISFVMITFGSAVGLSLTALDNASATTVTAIFVAGGLWLLWTQVSSFMGGAYVAGRLRRRVSDATEHEVEMRDGCHGLAVWAVALVIGAMMAGWVVMLGAVGSQNISAANANSYYAERLLRNSGAAANAAPMDAAASQEFNRVLARGAMRGVTLDDADRSFLTAQIQARSGLAAADAQARLDQTLVEMKAQVDKARRYGILAAFLTAASLLVSAVAAWWAAAKGGQHRDGAVDFSRYSRWR
jgi:hypothetical protein